MLDIAAIATDASERLRLSKTQATPLSVIPGRRIGEYYGTSIRLGDGPLLGEGKGWTTAGLQIGPALMVIREADDDENAIAWRTYYRQDIFGAPKSAPHGPVTAQCFTAEEPWDTCETSEIEDHIAAMVALVKVDQLTTKPLIHKTLTEPTAMSGAEFRMLREGLGLTTAWTAEHVGVAERTVHRWEAGKSPIPPMVGGTMVGIESWTAGLVAAAEEEFRQVKKPLRRMWTYRTDADLLVFHLGPAGPPNLPASWHRALCSTVLRSVTGLRASYRPYLPVV